MFSKETTLLMLNNRKKLLTARDPVSNANIIAKLVRRIRQLEKS